MKRMIIVLVVVPLLFGYGAYAQVLHVIPAALPDVIEAYPISVTEGYTTNLIFPFPIVKVDLGTGDLIARKLGRTENVLLLKPNKAHFETTNVSVYTSDGRLFSFRVSYGDTVRELNYSFMHDSAMRQLVQLSGKLLGEVAMAEDAGLVAKAKGFLHVGVHVGKMRLVLRGIYMRDGICWLQLMARNGSLVDFIPGGMQFSVADRKRVRRVAVQSVPVDPLYSDCPDLLAGGTRNRFTVGFRPFSLVKGKKLVVELLEAQGDRRVLLEIRGRDMERARVLR